VIPCKLGFQVSAAPIAYLLSTWLIAGIGGAFVLLIAVGGVWALRTGRGTHASQLFAAAAVAFPVLLVQVMVDARAHHESEQRQSQADQEAMLLLLGRQTNLSGVDLHGKNLHESYLSGKTLNGADFTGARLDLARLSDAQLVSVRLVGADLRNAHLDRSNLQQADLSGADLRGAWLRGAELDAATLGPNWKKGTPTDLRGAHLETAFLDADLRYANLANAHLYGAHLAPANLAHSNMTGADLTLADLRGAILTGANLGGAKNVDQVLDLAYAVYDANTRWPPDFTWPGLDRKCKKPTCTLKPKGVHGFPEEIRLIEKRLLELTEKKHCPTGWRTDVSNPLDIRVVSARGLADFRVVTAKIPRGTTPAGWAHAEKGKTERKQIDDITIGASRAAGGVGQTYAERSRQSSSALREQVVVYYVGNRRGLRYSASASPSLFPLFERDFATLFRTVGVRGNLFPELRSEAERCI
jgi:uncharacterized protein YjbI with pentapeptide repeats